VELSVSKSVKSRHLGRLYGVVWGGNYPESNWSLQRVKWWGWVAWMMTKGLLSV